MEFAKKPGDGFIDVTTGLMLSVSVVTEISSEYSPALPNVSTAHTGMCMLFPALSG
jgi:hypothetical protein